MAKKGALAEKAAELEAAVAGLFTGTPAKVKKAKKKKARKAAKKAKNEGGQEDREEGQESEEKDSQTLSISHLRQAQGRLSFRKAPLSFAPFAAYSSRQNQQEGNAHETFGNSVRRFAGELEHGGIGPDAGACAARHPARCFCLPAGGGGRGAYPSRRWQTAVQDRDRSRVLLHRICHPDDQHRRRRRMAIGTITSMSWTVRAPSPTAAPSRAHTTRAIWKCGAARWWAARPSRSIRAIGW